jgi:signal transduction histidine kinase
MSWTVQQRIRFGFWMLTLAPLLLGVMAVRNGYELAEAAGDVARTNELVKRLEQLLSGLKDIEVAQREYILRGDEQYVKHMDVARESLREGLRRIDAMHADPRWLELLRTAIPQKFEEIQKTVELRRKGGIEAASQMIMRTDGPQAMDDIRKIIGNMILEENALLEHRSAAQRQRFIVTMALFGAVLAITLALIWSVFYLIRRESEQARLLNAELERRVALRTEELQRSNEDLQQFAYVASHDMKEPLRMVSSYASLLQRRYQGQLGEDADTYIGFVVDGVKRMDTLITDLLEYSRAGQSKDEQNVPVDSGKVLQAILENLKVTIADSGAVVKADTLPEVVYDPLRLGQLFQNLIANAIKYRGPRKPKVHVSAVRQQDETVFSVRDNGLGIPPDQQAQIFGIFKRLHGKEIEGTGIGLAMCKKIVERNGGRIWVESEPGKGSTFFFTVPHAKDGPQPRPPARLT